VQLFDVQDHRKSTVDVVIDSLKELLINGKLKSGDLLPSENELCDQLKVSRTSVREAIKILSAFGIVQIKRGEGTYISNGANSNMFMPMLFQILVRERDMTSLVEVRELLESGIIKMVIENASEGELMTISRAADRMTAGLKNHCGIEAARELDLAFHKAIAQACHNSIIQEIYEFVIVLFAYSMNPYNAGVIEAHENIASGLKHRNLDETMVGLKQHVLCWIQTQHS